MKKLVTDDPQFEQLYAQAARGLDLDLEDDPALKPWGFFVIAAHGPFDGYQPKPTSAATVDEVWGAVQDWEELGGRFDLTNGPDQLTQIQHYASAIGSLTTDPFYCIEPTITYPVPHVEVSKQIQDRLTSAGPGVVVRKHNAPITLGDKAEPWFVNPEIVSCTYSTETTDSKGQKVSTRSLTILKEVQGAWKIHVMSNLIWIR